MSAAEEIAALHAELARVRNCPHEVTRAGSRDDAYVTCEACGCRLLASRWGRGFAVKTETDHER